MTQINDYWVEILYLFNPFTLINCISKNFDQIYALLLILCLRYVRNNLLGPLFFSFTLVVNHSGVFTCLSTLIYILYFTNIIQNRSKFLINFYVFLTIFLGISFYLSGFKFVISF